MAEIRSAEAQRIVQRLLKELSDSKTIESQTSTNSLKKIRRGLGALLFSPDYVGYIDVIDNKMRKGESPKQILSSIAGKSEKLVKSYSPIPGVFEAHHIIALNSLRDSFMGLPPDEQDKFLKKLADAGWEIGDSPKQLVDTVLTRMSHVGQQIKAPIDSDIGTIRRLKIRGREKLRGFKEHAHLKRILAGPAKTADDLITIFNKKIAPESIKAATTGLLQDANFRAYMETRGFPLDKVTPQIVNDYYSDPVKTQGFLNAISEGLGEFDAGGLGKEAIEQGQERLIKEAGPGLLTDPEGVAQAASQLQIDRLDGFKNATDWSVQRLLKNRAAQRALLGATVLPGAIAAPMSGLAYQQAKEQRIEDPSLRNRAVEFTTGMQFAGDTLDAAGTALAATGVGAPVGIPTAAVGGGISNVGAVAEQVITAPEAYQRSTEAVSERTGKTEEEVRADPLGYGSLFNTVKDKLGQIGLSGYKSVFN